MYSTLSFTNILDPLSEALKLEPPATFTKKGGYKKMIFLLTDGETDYARECLDIAMRKRHENTLIHTFGIGNDCDKNFV